jgi:NAD(P)-dependent dehydrogenase (short-subunit alcohol dehydrogenase family)
MERLTGKIAIVTGAGQGIGRAIAFGMAREGASVVIAEINDEHALDLQRDLERQGHQALAIPTDVAREDAVDAMVKRCIAELGGIDILVNNAGIYPRCSVAEMSEELWDRVLGTNLFGAFLCARAAVPAFLQRKRGRIINLSSGAAFHGARNGAHYTASKAGIIGFTKALALELAAHGITVNAICPGMTDTALPRANRTEEDILAHAQTIPLRRIAQPDDLAGPAVFLASDAAQFITGQALFVNGGSLMW